MHDLALTCMSRSSHFCKHVSGVCVRARARGPLFSCVCVCGGGWVSGHHYEGGKMCVCVCESALTDKCSIVIMLCVCARG